MRRICQEKRKDVLSQKDPCFMRGRRKVYAIAGENIQSRGITQEGKAFTSKGAHPHNDSVSVF